MQGEEPDLFSAVMPAIAQAEGRSWTPQQLRAIDTVGHNLLVSAAAGSGKTSVLAERCVHLVCDAAEPCDVDELLVVTFTEAAAAEMKGRIQGALRKRAEGDPSPRLARQLALVDRAHVSTLHSFCSRLLRQHFHRVGIDPTFSVLDGEEAKLLRREVARRLIDDRFERDDEDLFARLVDYYGDGDDGRIADHVIHLHEMLTSVRDPEDWSKQAIARIEDAVTNPIEKSELGRTLVDRVQNGLTALRAHCDQTIQYLRHLGDFSKYLNVLCEDARAIEHWQTVLREYGLDALKEAVPDGFDRLPSVASTVPNKDAAKAAIDSFRTAMKEGRWREAIVFSSAEWAQGLEDILPFSRLLVELVRDFRSYYQREKDSARTVDFADLERLALKALSEPTSPSSVALAYREQFKHVLVDEYQDINEVQDAILALLSRDATSVPNSPSNTKRSAFLPNLFCVGDVKQSIYRFRLADPERFLNRQKSYEADRSHATGEAIDLQSNFRSRPPLLEAINSVFERLMTEEAVDINYDDRHRLVPGLTFPPPPEGEEESHFTGSPIELIVLPNRPKASDFGSGDESADAPDAANLTETTADPSDLDRTDREALVVAQRVRELLGLVPGTTPRHIMERDSASPGGMRSRSIRRSDIVILLRAMKFKADVFADALRTSGVPVYAESGSGFFDATEIRDMLALLALLDNQRQDFPLAATLRGPLGNFANAEDVLARIRLAFPQQDVPFHKAAERYAVEVDDELAGQLKALYDRLAAWRFLSQRRPLPELIWTIYEESGYPTYVAGLHNGEQRVANLMSLHQRAAQFGEFHQQGLSRFLEFIETLSEETDAGQPSLASEGQDVVRIMSIHKSKGLEFPVVIVPDLGKKINLMDASGSVLADRVAGLGLMTADPVRRVRYPSLASMLVQQRIRQQSLAEEVRVLYVAMTRAKEHLILIGTADETSPQRWATRWGNHAGPLPPDAVLGVGAMLDWLGPVYAATGGENGNVMSLKAISSNEALALHDPSESEFGTMRVAERFVQLQPIDPPPPPNAAADALISRLSRNYQFDRLTHVPAAMAATAGKLLAVPSDDNALRRPGDDEPIQMRALAMPAFLAGVVEPAANDIGTVTHLVLEHLSYAGRCDAEDIEEQIYILVEKKLLTREQARWIDVSAIVWFASSELGERIRANGSKLIREIPLYLSRDPSTFDPDAIAKEPLDKIMIRGRIDGLLNLDGGMILFDYKTDRVANGDVSLRAETYRAQLEVYASALKEMTGKPVAETWVVFLAPRRLLRLS